MEKFVQITKGKVNVPVEAVWLAADEESAARAEVDVRVEGEDGRVWTIPTFHDGGRLLGFRFAAPVPGTYRWTTSCATDAGLDRKTGSFEIEPYTGDNPLYRHGRLRVAANKRTFEHADGTPFFWLADTWWMGTTARLDFPRGFRTLVSDRLAKGFNVIQIVAGLQPNFSGVTDAFHRQQGNEGGTPWLKKDGEYAFDRLNPAYYRHADDKIIALIEMGLMPCISGMWGFYLPVLGVENAKRHWRNLVARYAAFPVVFMLCGELHMMDYALGGEAVSLPERERVQQEGWTEVARYVRSLET